MSESRTVVTSETLMAQLIGDTQKPPAETQASPENTGDDGNPLAETQIAEQQQNSQHKPRKPLVEELIKTRHERNEARARESDANARVAQLQAELEEVRQRLHAQPNVQPAKDDPRPERSQFVSDADYQEALTDWKVDQRIKEREQEQETANVQAAQRQLADNWQRRLEAAKADLTDFDEVVGNSSIELPNHLFAAVVESDYGPQLAYHFAQHPEEARKLMAMSPTEALKMLGRLEDAMAAPVQKPNQQSVQPAAKQPETSKAPPPIDPLKNASTPVEKPTSQMTYQEYKAHRAAQQAAQRRR
jgi:hypothetical protein